MNKPTKNKLPFIQSKNNVCEGNRTTLNTLENNKAIMHRNPFPSVPSSTAAVPTKAIKVKPRQLIVAMMKVRILNFPNRI